MLIDLGNDHDNFGEASESTEACATSAPISDLLSIDQLLETVWPSSLCTLPVSCTWHGNVLNFHRHPAFQVVMDPAPQAGAIPVAVDMAFKDMTSHCEALTIGKQQKMSTFMSFQLNAQAAAPPSHHPNQMELDLFRDPQVPQVEYSVFF
jgi:protein EFR3